MNDFDKDSLRDSIHRDIHDRIRDQIHDRLGNRPYRYNRPASTTHGIVWGGAICIVGIMLLLDRMGLVSADHLWRFWPMLMIVAGAINLTQPGKRQWGAFLVVLGALFQLSSLNILHLQWSELWPVMIIAAGAMMIWNSIETRRRRARFPDSENTMNATAVFGGVERRITAQDFQFGGVNAVFGGVELDFHGAEIEGNEATIEVNAVFGGVEIRVPDNWRVEARNQTVFGGYTDTTRSAVRGADGTAVPTKTLFITGSVVFGGVEVKN
jgi:predicted membrane protein